MEEDQDDKLISLWDDMGRLNYSSTHVYSRGTLAISVFSNKKQDASGTDPNRNSHTDNYNNSVVANPFDENQISSSLVSKEDDNWTDTRRT